MSPASPKRPSEVRERLLVDVARQRGWDRVQLSGAICSAAWAAVTGAHEAGKRFGNVRVQRLNQILDPIARKFVESDREDRRVPTLDRTSFAVSLPLHVWLRVAYRLGAGLHDVDRRHSRAAHQHASRSPRR